MRPGSQTARVYRVRDVNRAIRLRIEQAFSDLYVEGEISDFTQSAAGHLYFTLNDELEAAQLSVVMFRADARRAKIRLANGQRVKLRGGCSYFEPRGRLQFIARGAEAAGEGDLAARFKALYKKLEAEGLFDPARRRPLPAFPQTIGVVTSSTGAALRDIIRVAHERMPVRIVIADCRVQGEGAPESIMSALESIQRLPELDLVIIGRGGGSAEDLWAFNDERLARAIAACRVPIVSAVGHEVDMTIADFVADLRAATPSNAAELAVPEARVLIERLSDYERTLSRAFEMLIGRRRLALERIARRLEDPRRRHLRIAARVEAYRVRIERAMRLRLRDERQRHGLAAYSFSRLTRDPAGRARERLRTLEARLVPSLKPLLPRKRAELRSLVAQLNALSPLSVLERGYAIALHEGAAVRRADELPPGSIFEVRFSEGSVRARAEEREDPKDSSKEQRVKKSPSSKKKTEKSKKSQKSKKSNSTKKSEDEGS